MIPHLFKTVECVSCLISLVVISLIDLCAVEIRDGIVSDISHCFGVDSAVKKIV